ncbi:MAG: LysM peptidoglycan-binding domain-containing protein [Gammaproteobacteria bacterium]|nr:LysM peptidoglycan-binding domain-containing protein [Gammaproteobacteria bacterium]
MLLLALATGGCVGPFIRDDARHHDAHARTAPVPPPARAASPTPAIQPELTSPDTEATPADVWARIRAGLRLRQIAHPDVERELRWFQDNPDFLTRVSQRARPILFHIVQEVERRDMPMEVALLPVVESAYQVKAYSPGHASGIWQFIESTGRRFGLQQDWWYDGRRDIVASTRAALDYLQILHRRFGDWELALAAYNCGELTVERARARSRRQGRGEGFWSLQLPAETRAYLPRLLAVAAVVGEPQRYGQALESIPDEAYFAVVDAGSQIELSAAARLARLSAEEFEALNPGYLRGATGPTGPSALLVPRAQAGEFQIALAALPREARIRWRKHPIREGETLGQIAARYGTSVSALQKANRLRGTTIRAGRDLIIPGVTGSSPPASSAGGGPAQVAATTRTHVVRTGDTLWDIARRHGVGVDDLAAWNKLDRLAMLRPGQRLAVAAPQLAQARRADDDAEQAGDAEHVRYKVRSGDSLWTIARHFDVRVEDLRRWNKLPRRSLLQPGQELRIFVAANDESLPI